MAGKTTLDLVVANDATHSGRWGDLTEAFEAASPANDAELHLAPVVPLRYRPFERLLPHTLSDLYAARGKLRRSMRTARWSSAAWLAS